MTPLVHLAREQLRAFLAKPFLVLDTETTGIEPHDQVIEVCVLSSAGEVLFNTLTRPTVPLHPDAAKVSGLDDAALRSAPSWPAVWPQLHSILRDRVVTAYFAEFDATVIHTTCAAHGLASKYDPSGSLLQTADANWICSQKLLEPFWLGERHSLATICHDLGIPPGGHRALGDCRALLAALQRAASHDFPIPPHSAS